MSIIGLYRTVGNRRKFHQIVIYLALDRDWGSLQLTRNGSAWPALATATMTPLAEEYRNQSHRATSLQYTGKAPADAVGMAADLEMLGCDTETVRRFVGAAAPYWGDLAEQKKKRRRKR